MLLLAGFPTGSLKKHTRTSWCGWRSCGFGGEFGGRCGVQQDLNGVHARHGRWSHLGVNLRRAVGSPPFVFGREVYDCAGVNLKSVHDLLRCDFEGAIHTRRHRMTSKESRDCRILENDRFLLIPVPVCPFTSVHHLFRCHITLDGSHLHSIATSFQYNGSCPLLLARCSQLCFFACFFRIMRSGSDHLSTRVDLSEN